MPHKLFQQLKMIEKKTFLLALEKENNTNRSTTKHIGHASENFQWTTHDKMRLLNYFQNF